MSAPACPYVTRAGLKLAAALAAFQLDMRTWCCVDFGSHAGGFVDCLLQHGAARVYAVEPGYGVLDYRLRTDPRVAVHERTNAMRFVPPEPADLVTIDVGWTPQRLILPAARRCLKPATGRVLTLIKPQYEAPPAELRDGVLPTEQHPTVLQQVREDIQRAHWQVLDTVMSPIAGHGGNTEYLWLLAPIPVPA